MSCELLRNPPDIDSGLIFKCCSCCDTWLRLILYSAHDFLGSLLQQSLYRLDTYVCKQVICMHTFDSSLMSLCHCFHIISKHQRDSDLGLSYLYAIQSIYGDSLKKSLFSDQFVLHVKCRQTSSMISNEQVLFNFFFFIISSCSNVFISLYLEILILLIYLFFIKTFSPR